MPALQQQERASQRQARALQRQARASLQQTVELLVAAAAKPSGLHRCSAAPPRRVQQVQQVQRAQDERQVLPTMAAAPQLLPASRSAMPSFSEAPLTNERSLVAESVATVFVRLSQVWSSLEQPFVLKEPTQGLSLRLMQVRLLVPWVALLVRSPLRRQRVASWVASERQLELVAS